MISSKTVEWKSKNILIAGDAAHIMPPFLGMGLAAGIKDIYNLVWKLAMVKDQILSPKTLATYQEEREPNVRYLIQLNLWVKRLFRSSKLRWIKGFVPILPKWLLKRSLDTTNLLKKGIIGKRFKGVGTSFISPIVINQKAKEITLNLAFGDYYTVLAMDVNSSRRYPGFWDRVFGPYAN